MPAKILVVEDNVMNMEFATDLLETRGYQVLQATTVPEAREILWSTRPDLILLDIQLPGVDGLTLAQELRNDPRTREIPIVALTALAMKGDEERVRQAGCSTYISKPIEMHTFLATVARQLALAHAPGDGGAAERPA